MDFSRCCESEDILDDDPGKFIRWVIHFMSCLFRDTQKQSYWKFQFETGHYLVQWSAVIVTLLPIPDSFILTLIEWQSVIVTLLPIPEGVTVIADRRSLHFFNASQLISTFGPSSQSMCNERVHSVSTYKGLVCPKFFPKFWIVMSHNNFASLIWQLHSKYINRYC